MHMPKKSLSLLSAATVALLMSSGVSHATGEIICDATDGSGASINVSIGRLPVLAILSATATDGANVWSTNATGGETSIVAGQGFMDDRQVLIDFTDPNIEQVLVSLRLFQASGDKSYAEAGVLSFGGVSAFPVQCENG
jgi:hypothetical protein